jgi:hypothetical protein
VAAELLLQHEKDTPHLLLLTQLAAIVRLLPAAEALPMLSGREIAPLDCALRAQAALALEH